MGKRILYYADYVICIAALIMIQTAHWKWGIALYVLLFISLFDIHKKVWRNLKWYTRKPRKHLHWWFGRKYYWIHSGWSGGGVVQVVIRERNENLISCMEKRNGKFNYFSCSGSSVFREKDDAIKALVDLYRCQIKDITEYWEKKSKSV